MLFLTSNAHKIHLAKANLDPLGIIYQTQSFPFIEIQSDNPKDITVNKAQQAFAELKTPLFVTDDSWYISALHNFPGAYMKHVNGPLKEDDFLRLLEPYSNREIILHRVLCYIDNTGLQTFEDRLTGEILREKTSFGTIPLLNIISFLPSKISVAEAWEKGIHELPNEQIWKDFAKWYKANYLSS